MFNKKLSIMKKLFFCSLFLLCFTTSSPQTIIISTQQCTTVRVWHYVHTAVWGSIPVWYEDVEVCVEV